MMMEGGPGEWLNEGTGEGRDGMTTSKNFAWKEKPGAIFHLSEEVFFFFMKSPKFL
jgi:hypothetical protein